MRSASLLLVVFTFGVVTAQDSEDLANVVSLAVGAITECTEKNGIELMQIIASLQQKKNADESVKCCLACIMEKLYVLSEDGQFQVELVAGLIESLPIESARKPLGDALQSCAAQAVNNNKCEKAWMFTGCLKRNLPKIGLAMFMG